MKLKNIGASKYLGQDFDGADLYALPGQEFEVSVARGEKLLKDYPGRFERVDTFVTLPPDLVAEFEVTADPADTSADGVTVTVERSSPLVDGAAGPDPNVTAPPFVELDAPRRRGRRRRNHPS